MTVSYTFSYQNTNDNSDIGYPAGVGSNKHVLFAEDASWPEVLREFSHFLSGVYGYDVADRVFIKEHQLFQDEDEMPEYSNVKDFHAGL